MITKAFGVIFLLLVRYEGFEQLGYFTYQVLINVDILKFWAYKIEAGRLHILKSGAGLYPVYASYQCQLIITAAKKIIGSVTMTIERSTVPYREHRHQMLKLNKDNLLKGCRMRRGSA